jgi:hypothetical protein
MPGFPGPDAPPFYAIRGIHEYVVALLVADPALF